MIDVLSSLCVYIFMIFTEALKLIRLGIQSRLILFGVYYLPFQHGIYALRDKFLYF